VTSYDNKSKISFLTRRWGWGVLEMHIDTKCIDITNIDIRILPDILASINRRNYIDISIYFYKNDYSVFFFILNKSREAHFWGKLGTEPVVSPRSKLHASFYHSR